MTTLSKSDQHLLSQSNLTWLQSMWINDLHYIIQILFFVWMSSSSWIIDIRRPKKKYSTCFYDSRSQMLTIILCITVVLLESLHERGRKIQKSSCLWNRRNVLYGEGGKDNGRKRIKVMFSWKWNQRERKHFSNEVHADSLVLEELKLSRITCCSGS